MISKHLYYRNATARCAVLYDPARKIAMFVELDDNKGMSVTNAIEDVAKAFEAEAGGLTGWRLFEAYEHRIHQHGGRDRVLTELLFAQEKPDWRLVSSMEAIRLFGEKWELP